MDRRGRGRTRDQDDLDRGFAPVAAVDFLGDLDNLLLLEGLRNLNELGGVPLEDGVIDIAHRVQAHDDVPSEVLLEHIIGLGLVHKGGEDGRVFPVRHPKQDAVVIGLDAPDGQIAGGGDELAVVIVRSIVEGVIVGIGLAARFQELDLVVVAGFLEFLDGAFGLDVEAVEGEVLVHEFQVRSVGLAQVAEIAAGDGMLHVQLAVREHVQGRLVHQEAQGAEVNPPSAGVPHVQELDVLVLVNLEFKALGDVVHLRRNDRVGTVELEIREHLDKGSPFRILPGGLRVLAIDLQHGNGGLSRTNIDIFAVFLYICQS